MTVRFERTRQVDQGVWFHDDVTHHIHSLVHATLFAISQCQCVEANSCHLCLIWRHAVQAVRNA